MKTPRFSRSAVSAVFALSLACGSLPLRAQSPAPDDAKRRAAAEELLKARKTDEMLDATITRMSEATDKVSDAFAQQAGGPIDPKEFAQKLRTEAHDMIRKDFDPASLRQEILQAYTQAFTETELEEMTAFYLTPTGKKLVTVEPEISGKLAKLSQEKTMPIMKRVIQRLRAEVEATKPAASPGTAMKPGAPSGFPVPPSPPPGMMIPPPPPPNMTPPAAPPSMIPLVSPIPSATAAPGGTPLVHPSGKSEPGTP